MTGLLDIAKSEKTVEIQGKQIPVYGISAKGFASIFSRFPEIAEMFQGRKVEFTPQKIIDMVPEAIAAFIAAGTGEPGVEAVEAVAAKLPAGDQMDLIEKIIEVTMPNGVGPFAEKVQGLTKLIGVQDIDPSGTPSPKPSSNSSPSDTTQPTSGPTPPDSSQPSSN